MCEPVTSFGSSRDDGVPSSYEWWDDISKSLFAVVTCISRPDYTHHSSLEERSIASEPEEMEMTRKSECLRKIRITR